jgi:predicted RNase H-like HicB family nuclease
VKFTVVIEQADTNFSVYVPDLPGCIATAATLEEAHKMIRDAIEFHLEGMLQHGETIPPATTRCSEVEIDVEQLIASNPPATVNP